MAARSPRVLIVDDEVRMGRALEIALRRESWACHACPSARDALEVYGRQGADVVITDLRMPGMDGVELMDRLHGLDPDLPVILVTAHGDVRSAVDAMRRGAFDYLIKPFDNDELRSLVRRALDLRRLETENARLRQEVGARFTQDLVAESPAMQRVLALVDRAASSDATVLVGGESGTGKEMIAKRLHYLSPRLGRPFIAVNCKAFSAGILESELFGHAKGAFTGADQRRAGCFERADGGTLFLDEIGEVDLGFQAKLLRVLQEGEVLPVGGDRALPVDVRLVAATNRDLRQEIAAGRFREDLFYRLHVIPVQLPPLRQRREDILPLALHFLARHAERGGRPMVLGEDATTALENHPWPGNVRELENALERAVVLAHGESIEPEDLLLDDPAIEGRVPGSYGPKSQGTLQQALDQCTAQRIRQALADHGGGRAAAARELGVDRSTLFRLMKRLGIEG